MAQEHNALTFEEITEADIPELTAVMTRAFDNDAQRHLGQERGGPEGYDNGDFFRKWLFGYAETEGYKALSQGKIVAAAIVWDLPDGHNVLGAMFVDPLAQDRGVGTRLWRFIEERYPQAQSWRLATPVWATKNHYFYEQKCGFHRIASDQRRACRRMRLRIGRTHDRKRSAPSPGSLCPDTERRLRPVKKAQSGVVHFGGSHGRMRSIGPCARH